MFFVIAIICILIGWYYHTNREKFALAAKIPSTKGLPLIGHAHKFIFKSPPEILEMLTGISSEFPNITKVTFGPHIDILITNPKYVESLLGSQKLIEKSAEYGFIEKWLGTGLLISTGKKWFQRRKVITPAFHFKILDQFTEIFDKHSSVLIECIAKTKGQPADFFQPVTACALDIICETAMGVEINAQISDSVYVQAVKEISGIMADRMFELYLRSDFIFNLTRRGRRQKELLKILHGFTDSVIISRREELMKKGESVEVKDEADDVGVKKKMAFLDVLLQSTIEGKPLNNMDIREEVDTFMFEGHDTTSSGIAFALYNLAEHPEIQQKAFEEVRQVFGDDRKRATTLKDLNDLNYLENVIKESLRLYPSVPFYARKISENVDIYGHIIPKGSNLIVGPYFMGRDPKLWKNPYEFNPERFSSDAPPTHPYANVPFSAGPRNCIGQKFAMLEMKSAISKILRNFELKVANGYKPILIAELILRPQNGVILIANDRKY